MSSSLCRRHLGLLLLLVTLLLVPLMLHAPAAGAGPRLVGVQTHVLWDSVDEDERDAQLGLAERAGAEIVRLDVGWASLEQDGKGRWSAWHLRRLDAAVDAARARGLKVLLTLWTTPCWASSAPRSLRAGCEGAWWERGVQLYPPKNPDDYADALAFLVRRLGARVEAWQVWNEPNHQAFLKTRDPAAAYALLLRRAYMAAKDVDRTATVVGGALSEADHRFTERLYRLGVKGSFDAWSIHPYSGDRSPLDRNAFGDPKHSFIRGVPAVREVMLRHRDPKPLWLTELGWSTSTARGGPTWANGVDADEQARHLQAAFGQVRRWPYVEAAIWYAVQDMSDDPRNLVGNFGLAGADGTPKPAFAAFRRMADERRAARAQQR